MPLFQSSVLKSHLALLNEIAVDKAYNKFEKYFLNPALQEGIKSSKEEQFQALFLNELFVNVLDYTLFPNPNANLTTEFKNEKNARKADGAILKGATAIAVIELKGTNTRDLESIRRQAFDYKANQKGCVYVITSNFEKLRFYINDATEFEEFDLFTLSRKRFSLLYFCLHKEQLLNNKPLTTKEASIAEEEQITKRFYGDYSLFKRELYRNLVKRNAKTVKAKLAVAVDDEFQDQEELARLDKNVKLTLFKKSQKLIDRFLFIFFAEDRMLLPSNSTLQILNKWRADWDFGDERSLYGLFLQYFGYLDTGRKGTESRGEIYAYNGGLFKPDAILDALEIDNDLLYKHTLKLSNYDFESQVDVNILGHIFENSLNEIESVNAEIEGGDFDKQTSKRKKDGVFYTPKYITKYIVENTVGKLCEEKRQELGFNEEEYFKGRKNRNAETIKKLVAILDNYRAWLLQLTICDPACGSGAFLNQALDFLIKEHSYIDELKTKVLGGGLQFSDIENTILENNIYGVDLNEESVEIAKLSLWLRTAQPRRKLNDLSSNIKCGNSLIESKAVAGDKAFKWETEFPAVFDKGGFDVVIGNPPYVKEYTNKKAFDGLHKNSCYQGKMDLWYFFGALALDIIKRDKGLIGYIAPNNWITNSGASKFRNIVLNKGKLTEFIDFGDFKVFDSAGIQTMIYIMKSSESNENYEFNFSKVNNSKIRHEDAQLFLEGVKDAKYEYFTATIDKKENLDKPINFVNAELTIIVDKIKSKQNFYFDKKEIAQGIVAPQDFLNKKNQAILGDGFKVGDGIFNITQAEYANLNLTNNEKKLVKPFYTTSELHRFYGSSKNRLWVIYTDSSFKNPKNIEPYPNLKEHLDKYQEVITSDNKPYGLHRSREEKFFNGEKIISLRKCTRPTFTFTDFDCYVSQTYFSIQTERLNQRYLTGLLNSQLIAFWLKYQGKMQGDLYQVDKEPLMNLPIINPSKEIQDNVADLVNTILLNSQKEIDYQELLDKAKSENNFDREIQLTKALEQLKVELEKAETGINQVVYELYGLAQEEIDIVENS